MAAIPADLPRELWVLNSYQNICIKYSLAPDSALLCFNIYSKVPGGRNGFCEPSLPLCLWNLSTKKVRILNATVWAASYHLSVCLWGPGYMALNLLVPLGDSVLFGNLWSAVLRGRNQGEPNRTGERFQLAADGFNKRLRGPMRCSTSPSIKLLIKLPLCLYSYTASFIGYGLNTLSLSRTWFFDYVIHIFADWYETLFIYYNLEA